MVQITLLLILIILAAFASLAGVLIGHLRLRTADARARDGRLPGDLAQYNLRAIDGSLILIPAKVWSILLFIDHSVIEFPTLLQEVQALANEQVVIVTRQDEPGLLRGILLDEGIHWPIVASGGRVYASCRVEAMPFAQVIDDRGVVRASGLVNGTGKFCTLWNLSHADPAELKTYLKPSVMKMITGAGA